MSTFDDYKQKIEAELELAHAKLGELKAEAGNAAADAHVKYTAQIDQLEHAVNAAKAKLVELSTAGDDAWEHLKEGAESALYKLVSAVSVTLPPNFND
ncbi:MAG: coiled coil domain-containing protein [Candidatus Methylumidiphilus sp.]